MDWLVEALEPLPETDERPAEAVVATGDPAVGVRAAGVLAGTGVPPAALVTACPAELAAEVAAEVADEVRLLAVWTSDCVELDAVLVTLCTAEEAAPVAVPAALETVEAAVEVTEDAVELTLEVTL
ncbi:MAG TPA: hypothetical protein VE983_12930, partial [Solirubrobacteraceae bacterium]|nr:hypothetical protein [Solirubrobacteraceae bacterium]